jgi:L-malate glycosyltransferase
MKILITFYLPSGGMETLNRIRAHTFIRNGIDCHLLYLYDADGKQNIKEIPTYITNNDQVIKSILDREQFDLVVINTDYLLMKRIREAGYQGPIVYEVQGLGTSENAKMVLEHASSFINRYADVLLYPKTPHLISLLGSFHKKKHFCFDNPIETEQFGYRVCQKQENPIIGWIGRIEANKNWSFFLEICYWMVQWKPQMSLWMFEDPKLGEETEKKNFEAMVDYLKLRPHLTRFSNIPHKEMADYLSTIGDSGGFLCSTSILEGFGYSVAEALLCRCPVVTSESDGIKNFIIHDVTGKIFPQGNLPKAVKEAKEMVTNLEHRNKMINNGESYIKTRYSPDRYVQSFVSMLNEIK